jgi:arylsulfatase A
MKMRIMKWITAAGLVMHTLFAVAESKPNIVLIMIDDLGYGDIGPFGATKCKTPALDRMASEGLKFTSFYAAPVCSASRAQIQTGCYAPRVSIPGVLPPASAVGLNPNENTVAKLLKAKGYSTMCIGKWHLGDQPEFFPTNYGYDHYFGIPYSNDMMRPKVDSEEKVVPLMRDNRVVELMTDAD